MAFDVFVLANQIYWKRDETFQTGACGVKKATQDLEYSTEDLIKAFETVGVDATCGEVPPPPPIEITNNQRIKNLSGDKGSKVYYFINVPPHTKMLQVQTSVGTGDVDLYTRAFKLPEIEKFDCRSISGSNREVCYLHNPKPGIHYILMYGYDAYVGTQLYTLIY
jgi:vibriolysin